MGQMRTLPACWQSRTQILETRRTQSVTELGVGTQVLTSLGTCKYHFSTQSEVYHLVFIYTSMDETKSLKDKIN